MVPLNTKENSHRPLKKKKAAYKIIFPLIVMHLFFFFVMHLFLNA